MATCLGSPPERVPPLCSSTCTAKILQSPRVAGPWGRGRKVGQQAGHFLSFTCSATLAPGTHGEMVNMSTTELLPPHVQRGLPCPQRRPDSEAACEESRKRQRKEWKEETEHLPRPLSRSGRQKNESTGCSPKCSAPAVESGVTWLRTDTPTTSFPSHR